MKRAFYSASISDFLRQSSAEILGQLSDNNQFALELAQRNAWNEEIDILKQQLSKYTNGKVFLEFVIPRMGKRVDALITLNGFIFIIEFKVGAKTYDRYALDQVFDYALDLKNFHEASHNKFIVPILCATKAPDQNNVISWSDDKLLSPLLCNAGNLQQIISSAIEQLPSQPFFDDESWITSGYKPTPTIIEAAQALYQRHNVNEISRSDAGAQNLSITANCISEIIERSKKEKRKSICFVTGVPGAGKTLAGLNIATQRKKQHEEERAVFLSGNGPLVEVLREALARDSMVRAKQEGRELKKKTAESEASAFIQNIHHFRDEALRSDAAPIEKVVVFDEAQRAWNQASAEKFMVQKRGRQEFNMSEPEFLISVMDRHQEWCTVVCLIGGGQEINVGEAGLVEWFSALQKRFTHWDIFYPPGLIHKDYSWGTDLLATLNGLNTYVRNELHLAVSVRSYRAEKLSAFVGALIDAEVARAQELYENIKVNYPIALTRDISKARAWLRSHARGSERYGLLASSGALRLKPEGINVKCKIEASNWFLNNREDVRSAYYLEDVATEFDIQGLELDWTCVCWDGDFRFNGSEWESYSFKGTKWQNVNDSFRKTYLANAYRVLLTRARQGMVIYVPCGHQDDITRLPSYYDATYVFLTSLGISPAEL